MRALLICALCAATGGSALKVSGDQPTHPTLTAVQGMMQSAPRNVEVQANACRALDLIGMKNRGKPGPFGGRMISKELLEQGYGELASQALLNILASSPDTDGPVYNAATACMTTLENTLTQNDRELGLAKYRNSPHLWDAYVGYFRRFRVNFEVLENKLCDFAGAYGSFEGEAEATDGLVRAGGFDLLMDMMAENSTSASFLQHITCAMSDHLQMASSAADAIVSHDGVNILTKTVSKVHAMPHYHEGSGFGVRYEILEDILGVIKNDKTGGKYLAAFRDAGLMEEVIKIMPDEPDDLYFQDHCCQVFNFLANGNTTMQDRLAKSDVADLVRKAATVPCAPHCTWPRAFRLPNSMLPPSCAFTHWNLVRAQEEPGTPWRLWNDYIPHP